MFQSTSVHFFGLVIEQNIWFEVYTFSRLTYSADTLAFTFASLCIELSAKQAQNCDTCFHLVIFQVSLHLQIMQLYQLQKNITQICQPWCCLSSARSCHDVSGISRQNTFYLPGDFTTSAIRWDSSEHFLTNKLVGKIPMSESEFPHQ